LLNEKEKLQQVTTGAKEVRFHLNYSW